MKNSWNRKTEHPNALSQNFWKSTSRLDWAERFLSRGSTLLSFALRAVDRCHISSIKFVTSNSIKAYEIVPFLWQFRIYWFFKVTALCVVWLRSFPLFHRDKIMFQTWVALTNLVLCKATRTAVPTFVYKKNNQSLCIYKTKKKRIIGGDMRLLVSRILKVRCLSSWTDSGMASLNDRALLKILINSAKAIVADQANSSPSLFSLIPTTTSLFFHQWNKTEPACSRAPQTLCLRAKAASIHFAPPFSTSLFFWRCSSPALIITELDDCNVSEYTILLISTEVNSSSFLILWGFIHTCRQQRWVLLQSLQTEIL